MDTLELLSNSTPIGISHVLTFKEAATFLRVSAPTLREILARKQIPAQKVGKQWRITKQSLLDYLSGKSHVPRSTRSKK